ncbi:MAG: hypothetical protein R3B45_04265 [Bdellovibrionota bacterium]
MSCLELRRSGGDHRKFFKIALPLLGRVDVSFPTTSQTLESQRCQGFKNYPQCTSSTPPVIFETLPSCDFQVFVSRYENKTSTRPRKTTSSNAELFHAQILPH